MKRLSEQRLNISDLLVLPESDFDLERRAILSKDVVVETDSVEAVFTFRNIDPVILSLGTLGIEA